MASSSNDDDDERNNDIITQSIIISSSSGCPFSSTAGHSTMEGRDEYLALYHHHHRYYPSDDDNGALSSSTSCVPSSSVQANPDTRQPLYFWQLYSLIGKQPILDICRDFYDFVFSDTNNNNNNNNNDDTTPTTNDTNNTNTTNSHHNNDDDQQEDWFRSVFERSASKEHHVQTQSTYWIDAMGGGPVYQGGLGRLNFHHHSSDARSIMNAKGARRWMHHMRASIRKNHFHFERIRTIIHDDDDDNDNDDDRVLPCLVTFLETKMRSYAKTFQWELDPLDFRLEDFYPSGKNVPQRHQQQQQQQQQQRIVKVATTVRQTRNPNVIEKKQENDDSTATKKIKKKEVANKRLIDWNVDLLKRMLRQIETHRQAEGIEVASTLLDVNSSSSTQNNAHLQHRNPRDEIAKSITFPIFDKKKESSKQKVHHNPDTTIELNPAVHDQLAEFMTFVASNYHDIPYHDFNHASNVAALANKLLQRVIDERLAMKVTHPLVQFSVVLAALIHDMDHVGEGRVPDDSIVDLYNGRSVAEQNSIDKAWSELMDPNKKYQQLQMAIFANPTELERFRKLLVNTVMATDMFDDELVQDRNFRWEQAFGDTNQDNSQKYDGDGPDDDLRATILVEHILQASNIGHTMQPLHGFKRWNERLFLESFQALEVDDECGQAALAMEWYEKQLRFFDDYVIPLAARLNDCGTFGNAGADLSSCARSNRKEWEEKGEYIVRQIASSKMLFLE
jgi:hypothetical protein